MADSNTTEKLCDLIRSRAEVGMAKYGVSLDRTDLKLSDWLEHSIQERLDDLGYMLRAKETAIELEDIRESVGRLVGEWKLTSEALKNVGAEITHTTYERLIGELSALIDGKDSKQEKL